MTPTPVERINRLRRQLHVNAVMYYHLDNSIVSDAVYDRWSNELVELHKQYPELVNQGYMHETFADWTGDTGMHLPITDEVVSLAQWLIDNPLEEE